MRSKAESDELHYITIHLFLPFKYLQRCFFWKWTSHVIEKGHKGVYIYIYIYPYIDSNRTYRRGSANWLNYSKHWWNTKFNSNLVMKVNEAKNSLIKIAKCESSKKEICKIKEKPVKSRSIQKNRSVQNNRRSLLQSRHFKEAYSQ